MAEERHEREITFYVNNEPVKTTKHDLTGAEIKQLAKVPADYQLFEVQGKESVAVGDNQTVHIHDKLHFRAIPPGTFGTNVTPA
jgi:hypothetical protein